MKDCLFVAYEPNVHWASPIITRLRESSSQTLQHRAAAWKQGPLRELQLAVASKLKMLDILVIDFDRRLSDLFRALANDPARVQECIDKGDAYRFRDEDPLPFELLLDIDSFLFESRSAYEILVSFLREFFHHILGKTLDKEKVFALLKAQQIDTRWIDELRQNRNLYSHETAPWIAVRKTSAERFQFELVILKEDVEDLSDPNTYLRFQALRDVYYGFNSSLDAIRTWVIKQIEDFEANE